MATGGENERDTVGGLDIPVVLTNIDASIANLIQQFAVIRNNLGHIPVSIDINRGTGEQIDRVVEEAANRARFNWKAIAQPHELHAALSSVQDDLERLATQAERTGRSISLAITGASGSSTFQIGSKQDVAGVLAATLSQGTAIGGGRDVTARVGLGFNPDPAGLMSASRVASAMAGATSLHDTRAEESRIAEEQFRQQEQETRIERTSVLQQNQQHRRNQQQMESAFSAMERGQFNPRAVWRPEDSAGDDANRIRHLRESLTRRLAPGGTDNSQQRQNELESRLFGMERGQFNPRAIWRPEDMSGSDANRIRTLRESIQKRLGEVNDALPPWLEAFAKGSRPQGFGAGMLRGPMTAMFGETGGAIGAGLGGMVIGGAMFHAGWEVINQMSKLPGRIAEYVRANQSIDIMRASQMADPGPPGRLATPYRQPFDRASASADAELMAKFGAGGVLFNRLGSGTDASKQFTDVFQTLQTESNKAHPLDPEQRRVWMQRNFVSAAKAVFGNLFAGTEDPLTVASAMQQMQMTESPEAMATLLKQPGMKKRMVDIERREMNLGDAFDNDTIWRDIQARLLGPYGITSKVPEVRQRARKQVIDSLSSMILNPSAREQAGTAIQQNHPLTALKEWWDKDLGTAEKMTDSDWDYITGSDKEWYSNSLKVPPARKKFLDPIREAWRGNFEPLLGGKPEDFQGMPFGNPKFSFSSLSDFANKMQTEASVHMIDYAAKTADNTAGIRDGVAELVRMGRMPGSAAGSALGNPLSPNVDPAVYEGMC
jgi:hypothetical protein